MSLSFQRTDVVLISFNRTTGECYAVELLTSVIKSFQQRVCHGELAATFDLAAFLVSMIAPVKESVNHLRSIVSMRKV